MAMSLLGETLDLHCGGVDLIFPHHEDEIAQSEGATGKVFSRVWSHGAFLLTDGAKMAKRVGNVQNVADLREQRISAAAVRYFMFTTHYRQELNLSGESLEAALNAVRRVGAFKRRLDDASGGTPALGAAANKAVATAKEALFDDLNAPRALAALRTFMTEANAELDRGGDDVASLKAAREAFDLIDGVLDVVPESETEPDLASRVEAMLEERKAARARRDFSAADAIRKALEEEGIAVEDVAGGTRWTRVR
jgi:cysteinyl-tRNA synthetase